MKCMNEIQKINPKQNNLSKESRNEARGPCLTGSFMMNLLFPHLPRCKLEIGVLRQMRLMINSRIGIKAKCFYQLMNKCQWILCFWHKHFLFSCLLASMQLKAIWVRKPLRLVLFLSYRISRLHRFGVT